MGQVNLGRYIFIFSLKIFGVVHVGDGGTRDDFLNERAGKIFLGDLEVSKKFQFAHFFLRR